MKTTERFELDDIDLSIFKHLQEDGRKPFAQIAREMGVSLNMLRTRFNKLKEGNVLRIITIIQPHELGFDAFAILNTKVEPQLLEEAIEHIKKFTEVTWIGEMTGPYNLALDVACRNMQHLHGFVYKDLAQVAGVRDIQISIHYKSHKSTTLPLISMSGHNVEK